MTVITETLAVGTRETEITIETTIEITGGEEIMTINTVIQRAQSIIEEIGLQNKNRKPILTHPWLYLAVLKVPN